MTTTKHTPAPWYVDGHEVRTNNSPHRIAQICGQTWDDPQGYDPEGQANAHLIAAVPELLQALKLLLEAYGEAHALYDLGECDGSILARAAIAKAKGVAP